MHSFSIAHILIRHIIFVQFGPEVKTQGHVGGGFTFSISRFFVANATAMTKQFCHAFAVSVAWQLTFCSFFQSFISLLLVGICILVGSHGANLGRANLSMSPPYLRWHVLQYMPYVMQRMFAGRCKSVPTARVAHSH